MDQSRKPRGKALASLLVVGLLVLVVLLDARRRQVEAQLKELTVRLDQNATGSPEENRAAAQAVIARVKQLIQIPDGVEPTVATIVDVDQLRAKNPFYEKAKNGDNLIVTSDRAILYDPVNNVIVDVVPVRIQQAEEGAAASKGAQKSVAASSKATSSAAASVATSAAASAGSAMSAQ